VDAALKYVVSMGVVSPVEHVHNGEALPPTAAKSQPSIEA